MKSNIRVLAIALGLCFAGAGFAATAVPAAGASAPAVAAPATAAVPAVKASMAPAATPAVKADVAPAAKKTNTAMPTVAAGGGDGKVWVNDKSKTYHCEGSKFYGKTKDGAYMPEADAKTKGNHAAGGKACAK